jgi:glycosidase
MKNPKLQLMVHAQGIGAAQVAVVSYPGVKLVNVSKAENPNYLFINLTIAPTTRPGHFNIHFKSQSQSQTIRYELKAKSREDGKTRIQGVTAKDFIYLLMPDRFANGDPSNDFFADMRDTAHNRQNPFDRHGGDLQGVQDHLDYLKDLGITTIWMTPVVENDMSRTMEGGTSRSTYHGYAFTDQYQVDRRLGGNAAYIRLINAAHTRGLKIIQDAVYNHVGKDHWFIRDLPMKDWVNQWPAYTNTSYRDEPLLDPYAAEIDRKTAVDGWFTPFMPDLNQRNPYVANFLIQYSIWATEEFGIDGWRIDTYFYSDGAFLNKINDALQKEFPTITMFGETLVHSKISSAYFTSNNFKVPFQYNCPGVIDAPLTYAMLDGLNEAFGWSEGVNKVYSTLAGDFVYKDPMRNCIFLDNHDFDRFYSVVGEDFAKFKMGINWLLTLRGIPQLYYGTEILMKNFKNPTDAEVRKDFPGGWHGDIVNKFLASGRTQQEQEAWTYIATLANFRKHSPALTSGKLMQYLPQNGLYVYFRYTSQQTVMVISNTAKQPILVDWKRFAERTAGFTAMRNVITGATKSFENFAIDAGDSFVFELMK